MIENIKREIDVKIAEILRNPQKEAEHLKINQDTSFDIFYDIYDNDDEKFFYIIMKENTANAPFYYIRSYTIQDLHGKNKIFKVFEEDNFDEITNYMKRLFEKKKVKISYIENKEDIINIELNVILFANEDKIYFELYREMIPYEEKDQKLLDLYNEQKNRNKVLKEIQSLLKSFNINQIDKEIINNINKILKSKEIPGIEDLKEDNQIRNEEIREQNIIEEINQANDVNDIDLSNNCEELIKSDPIINNEINKKIFEDLKKVYTFSKAEGKFYVGLQLRNIFDEDWPQGSVKLVYNEQKSHIKCKEIKNFDYEIGKGQNGDFVVFFDENDLKPGTKYKCCLQLYVNGKKITDDDVIFKIKVKK